MGERFSFEVGARGPVTATVYAAKDPIRATLVLAPGAGAPQSHPFMIDMATRVSSRGIDVVTFDFLYAEQGRRMPDRVEVLESCWRAAIASVRARGGLLPAARFFIGGKSMGGRIAAQVAAADRGIGLAGLVFLGYPLHPPNKPKLVRDVVRKVPFPMLFVQGSRDALGTSAEIEAFMRRVPSTRVHVVEGGDHSLRISKRLGPDKQEAALDGAADAVASFIRSPRGKR